MRLPKYLNVVDKEKEELFRYYDCMHNWQDVLLIYLDGFVDLRRELVIFQSLGRKIELPGHTETVIEAAKALTEPVAVERH